MALTLSLRIDGSGGWLRIPTIAPGGKPAGWVKSLALWDATHRFDPRFSSFPQNRRSTPLSGRRMDTALHVMMKRGMGPIRRPLNQPVFDRIILNIIHVVFQIFFVPYGMFPKSALPDPPVRLSTYGSKKSVLPKAAPVKSRPLFAAISKQLGAALSGFGTAFFPARQDRRATLSPAVLVSDGDRGNYPFRPGKGSS